MLLIDLSHTSHTQARTGVQRVSRSLYAALQETAPGVTAITHDSFQKTWRRLTAWELSNLRSTAPARRRSAQWPWHARWGGRLRRLLGKNAPDLPKAGGLIVPEIFSATAAAAWPDLFPLVSGPRIAIFHDAIALKFPEITPAKTVARFPGYLCELLRFDGIAANSEDSRQVLVDYWKWLGVSATPPVKTISLGLSAPGAAEREAVPSKDIPVVLSVGSIEGRKNHLPLLEACERLWRDGLRFELHLIGLAHPETGRAALEKIRFLQQAGRPLRYDGPVDENALEAAYAEAVFSVYPSLIEGFGLPVLESLACGKPCICSQHGAIGESARDGGCLTVSDVNPEQLRTAIAELLRDHEKRNALTLAARQRSFKSWSAYARELQQWMQTLS